MPKITRSPTAEELYSKRREIAKSALDKALTEARDLAHWAGRRIPNGPTSGFMTQGYVIGHTGDLDLALAQIIARVREDTANSIYCRGAQHVARIKPGTYITGTLSKRDDYATPKMAHESKVERNRRQLLVRRTGHCDNCGADFVSSEPGLRAGPAKRTPKQWREAFKSTRTVLVFPGDPDLELTPARKRARKARGVPAGTPVMFPGDHNLAGFATEARPRKEKIPNHKRSPTGALRGRSKGKHK